MRCSHPFFVVHLPKSFHISIFFSRNYWNKWNQTEISFGRSKTLFEIKDGHQRRSHCNIKSYGKNVLKLLSQTTERFESTLVL